MRVVVVPSSKQFCYVFGGSIKVSNGMLESQSDRCLNAMFIHEISHIINFKKMMFLYSASLILFSLGLLVIPFTAFPFLIALSYFVFCSYCRMGEYAADQYALRKTDAESVNDFLLNAVKEDTILKSLFFFFRWHPPVKKRLRLIKER